MAHRPARAFRVAILASVVLMAFSLSEPEASATVPPQPSLTLPARTKAEEQQRLEAAAQLDRKVAQLLGQHRYEEARPLAEQVLAVRRELLNADHVDTLHSLNTLGNVLYFLGHCREALELQRQATDGFRKTLGEADPRYAACLTNLADTHVALADYAEAEPLYLQSLAILEKARGEQDPTAIDTRKGLARLYETLARMNKGRGDAAAERAARKKAADLREPLTRWKIDWQTPPGKQALEAVEARLQAAHKDRVARLDPARRERLKNAERDQEAAERYNHQADYAHSEPLLREILKTFEELLGKDDVASIEARNDLAVQSLDTGDFLGAERLYLENERLMGQAWGESYPDYGTHLHNLGDLYTDRGMFREAEPYLHRALRVDRETIGERNHHAVFFHLPNLAKLYVRMKDYPRAERCYLVSIGLIRELTGDTTAQDCVHLKNLSHVYLARGDFARAERLLLEGEEKGRRIGRTDWPIPGSSLFNRGWLYLAMGDLARAAPVLTESLQVRRQHFERTYRILSETRQLELAASPLRSSLDAYLSVVLEAGLPAEPAYVEMLAWKGTAFARQRWLRLVRHERQADPQTTALVTELQENASRLANAVFAAPRPDERQAQLEQIRRWTERQEELEANLARRDDSFQGQHALLRPAPAEIQSALPAGVALIDFLEFRRATRPPAGTGEWSWERHLLAFVLRADRPIMLADLGAVALIADAVRRWRAALTDVADAAGADPGAELRRLLWQPLAPALSGARALLVSPDGPLAHFPLAALPGSRPDSYLIEELPTAVIPVSSLLPRLLSGDEAHAQDAASASLLLVGDVDFGPDAAPPRSAEAARGNRSFRFTRLPGTAGEVESVGRLFRQMHPGRTAEELLGAAATEQAFRKQVHGKRYIHLATHGFFDPPDLRPAPEGLRSGGADTLPPGLHPGLLSGVALAGANRSGEPQDADRPPTGDGILTALEVAEMDLGGTELVVLSACETGLGLPRQGEGLLGLQRAFQIAGARTVLASLWQVDDQATQRLMASFYDNLWHQHLPPLQALRRAQLSLLNDPVAATQVRGPGAIKDLWTPGRKARTSPRLWAPWVVSGDPGDLTRLAAASPEIDRAPAGVVAAAAPVDVAAVPVSRWKPWLWVGPVAGLVLLIGWSLRHRRRAV
jgi:CHAT domain-containing protein